MPNEIEMPNKPPTCYWFVTSQNKKIPFLISFFIQRWRTGFIESRNSMWSLFSILSSRMCFSTHRVCQTFISLINIFYFFSIRPMMPFMINYHFLCKDCSPNKPEEQFVKKTASM